MNITITDMPTYNDDMHVKSRAADTVELLVNESLYSQTTFSDYILASILLSHILRGLCCDHLEPRGTGSYWSCTTPSFPIQNRPLSVIINIHLVYFSVKSDALSRVCDLSVDHNRILVKPSTPLMQSSSYDWVEFDYNSLTSSRRAHPRIASVVDFAENDACI